MEQPDDFLVVASQISRFLPPRRSSKFCTSLGPAAVGFCGGTRAVCWQVRGSKKRIEENIEQKDKTEQDSTDVDHGLLTSNHSSLNNSSGTPPESCPFTADAFVCIMGNVVFWECDPYTRN